MLYVSRIKSKTYTITDTDDGVSEVYKIDDIRDVLARTDVEIKGIETIGRGRGRVILGAYPYPADTPLTANQTKMLGFGVEVIVHRGVVVCVKVVQGMGTDDIRVPVSKFAKRISWNVCVIGYDRIKGKDYKITLVVDNTVKIIGKEIKDGWLSVNVCWDIQQVEDSAMLMPLYRYMSTHINCISDRQVKTWDYHIIDLPQRSVRWIRQAVAHCTGYVSDRAIKKLNDLYPGWERGDDIAQEYYTAFKALAEKPKFFNYKKNQETHEMICSNLFRSNNGVFEIKDFDWMREEFIRLLEWHYQESGVTDVLSGLLQHFSVPYYIAELWVQMCNRVAQAVAPVDMFGCQDCYYVQNGGSPEKRPCVVFIQQETG